MEYLQFLDKPVLHQPRWIGAFIGWADAQEGASTAIRHLVRHFEAKKFAELDPEEFYDFTAVRPIAYNNSQGQRVLRWPSNEFFYWQSPEGSRDLILFVGTEPNLKWRTYTRTLLQAVEGLGVRLVVNLGSLLDALPHTREPLLSGGANKEELKARLGGLRIMGSNYQGPVGITSAFMDACTKAGLDHMSIWAHAPHYVQRSPNYKVTRALIAKASELLEIQVPGEELRAKAQSFEAEVTRAIASNVDVSTYVKRLERQYDENAASQKSELPSPEAAVREVEEFLRKDGPPGGFTSN